ncbi:MAG: thiamine phosphate synthase [Alphaproteobacteria bacterium]|jgi:thiamine-phosphate pyrophosphorylase|nr:thiamine phosphate synthase [Alphaproteobacteria bacterium]
MQKRYHPLPSLWLMTDERMGDALLPAVRALPRGAGIIFRHYTIAPAERRRLFDAVRKVAQKRRLMLILAGTPRQARAWHADGSHGRHKGAVTAPVHNLRELDLAQNAGARLLFLSPIFPTRSHPGLQTLGRRRFAALCRHAQLPVIALGGMTAQRFRQVKPLGAYGWAAIDGLTPKKA